jgi:hypothetical protein
MTVVVDRLSILDSLTLAKGSHESLEQGACVMEVVAYIAGEPWSDHPVCVSPLIAGFLRSWNDAMDDSDRQQLKPLIPWLVGTVADDATEQRRAWMVLDWFCRASTTAWLRCAGLAAAAERIEATAPIVDSARAKAAQGALAQAKSEAAAARDAAGAAARAAAGAAAWAAARAAAGAAVWAAAWAAAGAAAWAVAWDAARAAAGAAAGAAAWDALRPTVVALQASAIELVNRMIAA